MKKTYFFLCAFMTLTAVKTIAQPADAPTVPTKNPGDVISFFSDTYTNIAGTNFTPGWGQSTVTTDETIAGNAVKKLTDFNYQGVEFYQNQPVNLSNMGYLHIDMWSEDCTEFDLYLIYGGPEIYKKLTLTPSSWNSFDIPLSEFADQGVNLSNVYQFKFVSTPFGGTTVYYDNIYFWKDASTPTITGFSVPEKHLGDADFTLTPPTSNSNGAFSYTSSNIDVATVTDDVVHIVGIGTTIITATQAADGIYNSASVNTTFVVSYPPPTTTPIAPTQATGDVISIYSDSYTNVTGINYNPFWGQQTSVTQETIVDNEVIKLANFNYQGVDFGQTLDVSGMEYLHIDIWSPDCTEFDLYPIYGGPEQFKRLTLTTPSTWHSFDIPLSEFANLGVDLTNVYQFKFVSATPNSGTTVYYDNAYFWKTNILPVSLSEFKVYKQGNSIILNWRTESEYNNKGFRIERSSNGTEWTQLQFINGAGTTSAVNSYVFTDNSPVNGVNYYRLVQIDNDARKTYSDIKSVEFSLDQQLFGFTHPNPVKNNVVISLKTITSNNALLYLTNTTGKTIKTIQLNQQNSNSDIILDVQNCTQGIYFLSLKDGKNINTSKLIIY